MKKRNLKELLYKFGKINVNLVKINDVVASNDIYNYRNKVKFHVDNNKIGFYKYKSKDLVCINECKIVNENFNKILKVIKKNIKDSKISEIILRCGEQTNEIMVILKTAKNIDEKLIKNISNVSKNIKSIYQLKNNKYKLIYGEEHIHDVLLDKKFRISPDSFFQVNTYQAEKLFSQVLKHIDDKDRNILDLYCGIGTISIIISNNKRNIIGVDIVENAIKDANINKEINKVKNVKFIREDVSNVLPVIKKANKRLDVIILDPPRTGIDKNSLQIINELLPKKLIYVSCNPVTLARDLKELKNNYNIKEITPFDMFPLTHHVESVTLLSLKSPDNKEKE